MDNTYVNMKFVCSLMFTCYINCVQIFCLVHLKKYINMQTVIVELYTSGIFFAKPIPETLYELHWVVRTR